MPTLTIGLDIANNVFQVHGVDRHGNAAIQRKPRHTEVLKFFARLEPSLIGIEACHSSHFWARELRSLGHTVRLLPITAVTGWHVHQIVRRVDGGTSARANLFMVHPVCHQQIHSRGLTVTKPAPNRGL